MTPGTGPNPYLKTKIMTATREELRLMLFDGAIKFARQGAAALQAGKHEELYNNLLRAQKIVLELSTSLNHEVDPDLCEKLSALYTYIYRLLVDAHVERDLKKLEEAIELISFERDTWVMLMKKLAEENRGAAGAAMSIVGAQQTAVSTLSKSA
jgi:flagellar protein FliS